MSNKANKRRETIEIDAEPVDASPSAVSKAFAATASRARWAVGSVAALASAHRWKIAGTALGAVAGVLVATGAVDVAKVSSDAMQYATSRMGAPGATQTVAESAGTPSAMDVLGAVTARSVKAAPAAPVAAPIAVAAAEPSIATCFTPGENCTAQVVAAIDTAKTEIRVQAYSLSTASIIDALGRAQKRGVRVHVILDKADEREVASGGARLISQRILPLVDAGVAIAHNKVIMIDEDTVIMSSFNFDKLAQTKNAESLLVIKGHPDVAAAYRKHWDQRLAASRPYYGTMAPVM